MTGGFGADAIRRCVRGRFGTPLRWLPEVGSTNDVALRWASDAAPEGALVVADHQTAGRGRWGRGWVSAPGQLLQFSLVLHPRVEPSALGLLSIAAGLACADAIEDLTDLPARVKWPNDVVIGGRKVAGILIETLFESGVLKAAVLGMGINIGWTRDDVPPEIAERATSLAIETGRPPPREELLASVLSAVERRYAEVEAAPDLLLAFATQRSDVIGRDVTIRFLDGATLQGRATRLLQRGELEVETEQGRRSVAIAEIEQLR